MSVIQPQSIYTGKNIARPDFSKVADSWDASFRTAMQQAEQRRQFDIQRQDRITKDFLKTIDIDQINYTNANLQQKALDVYKNFDGLVSQYVENKKGRLDTEDIMKMQAVAKRAEQD